MEYIKIFRSIILNMLKEKSWSRRELAQRIDMDPTLITSMLRGERRFNEDQVIALARVLDVEPYRLFTPEGLIPESHAEVLLSKAQDFKNHFQMVEEIAPVACGNLSSLTNQSVVGYKVFEKKFLRGMYKPFLTRASGDSMFPTLSDGDLVLFNRDPEKLQNPDPNRIYLVNLAPCGEEPALTIKRIEFSRQEWTLTTIPDNRMYPIEKHTLNERHSILDYVLGVAMWIGKELG